MSLHLFCTGFKNVQLASHLFAAIRLLPRLCFRSHPSTETQSF